MLLLKGSCLLTAAYAAASPSAEAALAGGEDLAPCHRRLAPLQVCAEKSLPIVDIWHDGEWRWPKAFGFDSVLPHRFFAL